MPEEKRKRTFADFIDMPQDASDVQDWYFRRTGGNHIRLQLGNLLARDLDRLHIDAYMSQHRFDTNINELKMYFNSVIDWVSTTFTDVEPEMRGLGWGYLYEKYHTTAYDPADVSQKVQKYLADDYVTDRRGVFEFVLGGCQDTKLLNTRVFNDHIKKTVYKNQTTKAKERGKSNCPLCAIGHDANRAKIWDLKDMDADHVTAWSRGGATDIWNCQMLCKTHNRAKGNR